MKEELEKQIEALDKEIFDLSVRRATLKQELAELVSEFKVGDYITYEGADCVWLVTRIVPGCGVKPKLFGRKIKKDGTPAKCEHELWHGYFKSFLRSIILSKIKGYQSDDNTSEIPHKAQ